MTKYLFCDDHNGFERTYHPFECPIIIDQEKANKLILEVNPTANRIGSSVEHLCKALFNHGYECKIYKSIYHKPEENHLRSCSGEPNTDPLPSCMYQWNVINCISGNY